MHVSGHRSSLRIVLVRDWGTAGPNLKAELTRIVAGLSSMYSGLCFVGHTHVFHIVTIASKPKCINIQIYIIF